MGHADLSTVTTWRHRGGYELAELAEVIPMGWRTPPRSHTGVGRMVDLFTGLMRWAGRKENSGTACLTAAMTIYQRFEREGRLSENDHPFTLSEVSAAAKVVERYRREWAARGWHHPAWIGRQRSRGRKSGKVRRAKTQDRDRAIVNAILWGQSMRRTASEYGLTRQAVLYIFRRDAGLFASLVTGGVNEPT